MIGVSDGEAPRVAMQVIRKCVDVLQLTGPSACAREKMAWRYLVPKSHDNRARAIGYGRAHKDRQTQRGKHKQSTCSTYTSDR